VAQHYAELIIGMPENLRVHLAQGAREHQRYLGRLTKTLRHGTAA